MPGSAHANRMLEVWQQEAAFGARNIAPVLDGVAGARVLEVGSGIGILLRDMATRFPDKIFVGLEPFGDGFHGLEDLLGTRADPPNIIERFEGYEAYDAPGQFDAIYAVNVFEHLPDWRDFVGFLDRRLAPGGVGVFLCPNYTFPYEPHYRIPVIGTKALTRRVFARHIDRFDAENDTTGLWTSLNFVKARQVRAAVRGTGLSLDIDTSLSFEFLERLKTDSAFAERQGGIGRIAGALARVGVLDAFAWRGLADLHPYMMLRFTR